MKADNPVTLRKSSGNKIVFVLSIILFLFWIPLQMVNVYHVAITGVIFEILWLPMVAMIFVLPILSLIFWVRARFSVKSLSLFSLLLIATTILLLVFHK